MYVPLSPDLYSLSICTRRCFSPSSVNVNTSAAEERVLLTGLHEVADIYCECCKTLLGWKYVSAGGARRTLMRMLVSEGTCLRIQSEVQGRQIHHRTRSHDQGQRVGRRACRSANEIDNDERFSK